MAISPFDRLRHARSQIVEKRACSTARAIIAQSANLVTEKTAVPRTRDSVRRASDFVQIPISLTIWVLSANALIATVKIILAKQLRGDGL
jgi:hypothetical protein